MKSQMAVSDQGTANYWTATFNAANEISTRKTRGDLGNPRFIDDGLDASTPGSRWSMPSGDRQTGQVRMALS
jgi:hypothetical protein